MKKPYKKNDSTKFKKIEFAPQVAIDQYQDLANQFLYKVFGIEGAWISDESSLYDFDFDINEDDNKIIHHTDQTLKKIQQVYGLDVSDVEGLNLLYFF
jgi:hypothetical protein